MKKLFIIALLLIFGCKNNQEKKEFKPSKPKFVITNVSVIEEAPNFAWYHVENFHPISHSEHSIGNDFDFIDSIGKYHAGDVLEFVTIKK